MLLRQCFSFHLLAGCSLLSFISYFLWIRQDGLCHLHLHLHNRKPRGIVAHRGLGRSDWICLGYDCGQANEGILDGQFGVRAPSLCLKKVGQHD